MDAINKQHNIIMQDVNEDMRIRTYWLVDDPGSRTDTVEGIVDGVELLRG